MDPDPAVTQLTLKTSKQAKDYLFLQTKDKKLKKRLKNDII